MQSPLLTALQSEHPEWFSEVITAFGETTFVVPREHIVATCKALQGPGLEYVGFSDVTAVDFHPNRLPRFDLMSREG